MKKPLIKHEDELPTPEQPVIYVDNAYIRGDDGVLVKAEVGVTDLNNRWFVIKYPDRPGLEVEK